MTTLQVLLLQGQAQHGHVGIADLGSHIVEVAAGGGTREKEPVTVRGTRSLGSHPVRWSPGVEPLWVRAEKVFRCHGGREARVRTGRTRSSEELR